MVVDHLRPVTDPVPNAIKGKFGFFFTLFEWEAEGRIKLDKIGLPRHPMKFELAGRILGRAGGYDAGIPKPIADFGGVTVGRLAEKLDYEITDPKRR